MRATGRAGLRYRPKCSLAAVRMEFHDFVQKAAAVHQGLHTNALVESMRVASLGVRLGTASDQGKKYRSRAIGHSYSPCQCRGSLSDLQSRAHDWSSSKESQDDV